MKNCKKLKAHYEKNNANMIEQQHNQEDDQEYVLSIRQGQSEKLMEIQSNMTEWILDSGATSHIANKKELFSDLKSE